MLSRLALDLDGPVLGVLDGGPAFVDQGSEGSRGEYGRNSGTPGPDSFGQGSLMEKITLLAKLSHFQEVPG